MTRPFSLLIVLLLLAGCGSKLVETYPDYESQYDRNMAACEASGKEAEDCETAEYLRTLDDDKIYSLKGKDLDI